MAFLNETYDINNLPEGTNYDLIPAGWYNASITKAEIKNTSSGTGQYIAVRYDITGPSHQGRVVFGNLNIKNQSAKAEEIGRQQLGEIMRAIGVARVTDTDQLIGGSLQIKIAIKDGDEKYEARNEIKGFKAVNGSQPPMPAASTPASSPQANAGTAPPWVKK